MIFGQKGEIAFEFRGSQDDYFVFLWLENFKIGLGRESGTLRHCIRSLKKYLLIENKLIQIDISQKDDLFWFNWILEYFSNSELQSEQIPRSAHIRFLGDQLDEFTLLTILDEHECYWIIRDNLKKKFYRTCCTRQMMSAMSIQVIDWYESNYGQVMVSLNSFP